MKTTIFWHVTSCSLAVGNKHFRGTSCPHAQCSGFLWKTGTCVLKYTVQQPRRPWSPFMFTAMRTSNLT